MGGPVETTKTDLTTLWPLAERLADAARVETLRHFRQPDLTAESKRADFDPVTVADRASEETMRALLAEARPEDGILGEEFGRMEAHIAKPLHNDPLAI